MPRLELRAFSEDLTADAGRLLADRHRAHRAAEPLLPAGYADEAAAALEVAALWRSDGASGAAVLRGSRVVGFLLGIRKADEMWGANVWVEPAGHAVESAEDVRDLYAAAAARWVEEGRTRHYAMVPASDAGLVDAWFRAGFGQQHAYGIREVSEGTELPNGVRHAEPGDLDALVELSPLISEHQALSPVFGPGGKAQDDDALRKMLLEDLADAELGELVAEQGGRVVGSLEVVPVEKSSIHSGLARPAGAALLGWAATRPDVRGSGAGVALTEGCLAWARRNGYETMVTDWRVTNLLSSRFWPARGFRTSFLRLYRSIP